MRKILSYWENFWFRPMTPEILGLSRIFFFAVSLYFFPRVEDQLLMAPNEDWQPIGLYHLTPGPWSLELREILIKVWGILCVLGLLGLFSRWTLKLAALVGLMVLSYHNNFTEVYHSTHVPGMLVLILGLSRAGESLSLDQWLRSKKGLRPPEPDGSFRWPFELCKAYVVWSYFINGVEKFWYSGFESLSGVQLAVRLVENPNQTPFAVWLMQAPDLLLAGMSTYSVLISQILAPSLYIFPKLGYLYPFIFFFFHLGVTLSFGWHIMFFYYIAGFIFVVPLEDLIPSRAKKR